MPSIKFIICILLFSNIYGQERILNRLLKIDKFYKLENDIYIEQKVLLQITQDTLCVALLEFEKIKEYLAFHKPSFYPDEKNNCYDRYKKKYQKISQNYAIVYDIQDTLSAKKYKQIISKNKKINLRSAYYEWCKEGFVIDKNGKIFKPEDNNFKAGVRLSAKWIKIKE